MAIQVVSTTDSEEAVTAAIGGLAQKESEETNKAASERGDASDENTDESATSDTTEGNEDSDATDGDDNEDSGEEKSQDEKPKRKSGFQRRVEKLNKRISEKDRELEYWKSQALKNKNEDVPKQTQAQKPDSEGKPNPDDFDSHNEYVEALTEWKLEKRLSEREAKQREAEVKTQFQKQVEAHQTRVKSFAEKHEDFMDLMEDVDDVPMSVTVQEVILSSENGPELMYELAKNRKEYERICRMPAIQAARELGKFEARINKSSESTSKEVKKTKAPPPIAPVGSKSAGSVRKSIYDPNLSQREYERLRAEQEARRRDG